MPMPAPVVTAPFNAASLALGFVAIREKSLSNIADTISGPLMEFREKWTAEPASIGAKCPFSLWAPKLHKPLYPCLCSILYNLLVFYLLPLEVA